MRRDQRETATSYPEGFRYRPDLIGPEDEEALLARVRSLPFREFEFHGYTGKRRVVSFGWHYDFSGRQLRKADDIPDFLLPLRQAAAVFASLMNLNPMRLDGLFSTKVPQARSSGSPCRPTGCQGRSMHERGD